MNNSIELTTATATDKTDESPKKEPIFDEKEEAFRLMGLKPHK